MPATTFEECEAKRKVAREGRELPTGWTPAGTKGGGWSEITGFEMKCVSSALPHSWSGAVPRSSLPSARARLCGRSSLRCAADALWLRCALSRIFQHSRPYVWFAVFCDCSRLPDAPGDRKVPVEVVSKHQVELNYLQTDGGHLPCDEFGLPALYLLCTLGVMCYAVFYFMQLQHHQSTTGQIHPVTACIGIVLLLQWFAMVFEQVHLWNLEASGRGSPFSNGVSHFLSWLATSVMTAVLVLISYGWTITSDSLGAMVSSTAGGVGLAAVYGAKVLVIFLSYLGVIDSVDHAMYHDYENRGGQLVAMLQIGTCDAGAQPRSLAASCAMPCAVRHELRYGALPHRSKLVCCLRCSVVVALCFAAAAYIYIYMCSGVGSVPARLLAGREAEGQRQSSAVLPRLSQDFRNDLYPGGASGGHVCFSHHRTVSPSFAPCSCLNCPSS